MFALVGAVAVVGMGTEAEVEDVACYMQTVERGWCMPVAAAAEGESEVAAVASVAVDDSIYAAACV